MTWGQLRHQLQISATGVSLDQLDGYLNARYEQILKAADWTGVKSHAPIQTLAAYQSTTDTCTLTVGLATVTGAGTAWAVGRVGQRFYRPGDTALYTVVAVGGPTALTLDRPYEGSGSDQAGAVKAGSAYVFMQHVYPLPADCSSVVQIIGSVADRPLLEFSQLGLDRSTAIRTLLGEPEAFAVYDDTPEAVPPVLHQVEFYPPPQYARGLELSYIRTTVFFDGQSTNLGPLPWVSSATLIYGCKADIAIDQEKFNKAKAFETLFESQLAADLRQEFNQRKPYTAMSMASRFTRHRLQRVNRGRGAHNFGPDGPAGVPGPN